MTLLPKYIYDATNCRIGKKYGNNLLDSPNKKEVNYRCASFKVPSIEEIREAGRKKIRIVFCVYGDDSSDERKERIFAVAGVMGTQEEWDKLKIGWVEKTNGIPFHATDLNARPPRGVYEGLPEKEAIALYKDLTILLINSPMVSYGTVVDLKSYREILADTSKDAPYLFCFRDVIAHFILLTKFNIPQQGVKFTFDLNVEVRYSSACLFEYLTKYTEYKELTSYIEQDEMSYAGKNMVGIQVADLFAFETMKCLDNHLAGRARRRSFSALTNAQRLQVQSYLKNDFVSLRRRYGEEDIARDNQGYIDWLQITRRVDNVGNKIQYLMYRDEMKKINNK